MGSRPGFSTRQAQKIASRTSILSRRTPARRAGVGGQRRVGAAQNELRARARITELLRAYSRARAPPRHIRALRARPSAHAVYAGGAGSGALAQARPMRQRRRERAYRAQRRRRHKGDGKKVRRGQRRPAQARRRHSFRRRPSWRRPSRAGRPSEREPAKAAAGARFGRSGRGGGEASCHARTQGPGRAARRREGCRGVRDARSRSHQAAHAPLRGRAHLSAPPASRLAPARSVRSLSSVEPERVQLGALRARFEVALDDDEPPGRCR